MSTFDGFIQDFEFLAVDRFIDQNRDAKVFFLSHCHYDHMVGLSEINKRNPLPGPLYLSEVSSIFVNKRFPAIEGLVVLKIGGIIVIATDLDGDKLVHCLMKETISNGEIYYD